MPDVFINKAQSMEWNVLLLLPVLAKQSERDESRAIEAWIEIDFLLNCVTSSGEARADFFLLCTWSVNFSLFPSSSTISSSHVVIALVNFSSLLWYKTSTGEGSWRQLEAIKAPPTSSLVVPQRLFSIEAIIFAQYKDFVLHCDLFCWWRTLYLSIFMLRAQHDC